MRTIKYIIIHCSAGRQTNTAQDVINYHCRSLGWKTPGYHYIIDAQGNITNAVAEDKISNGVKASIIDADGVKVNATAINVCYIGGVDVTKQNLPPIDNRTAAQKLALINLLKTLRRRYPSVKIRGHRDFQNKACPCFDAKTEYKDL